MPTARKGAAVAKKDAEDAKAARGRSRIKQRTLDKGEVVLVRFLSEHEERADYPQTVISAKTHNFADTKPQPAEFKGDNWPKSMWGICPLDPWFRVEKDGVLTDEYEPGYGRCFIHERDRGKKDKFGKDMSMPADQVYGLAVICEPVIQKDGAGNEYVADIRDLYHDWKDAEGTVHKIPEIVYFSQKWSNFWAPAVATAYLPPRTILGKVFRIERVENDYTVTMIGQTPSHQPGTDSWKVYEEALKIMDFDLEAFLLEHASEDHYARWFDPSKTPKDGYGRKDKDDDKDGDSSEPAAGSAAQGTTASAPKFDQSVMADFQGQLKNRGKTAAQAEAPAAEAEPTAS